MGDARQQRPDARALPGGQDAVQLLGLLRQGPGIDQEPAVREFNEVGIGGKHVRGADIGVDKCARYLRNRLPCAVFHACSGGIRQHRGAAESSLVRSVAKTSGEYKTD